jgi:cycloeucalenol cycloisomerase
VTYHTIGVIVLRRVRTSELAANVRWLWPLTVVVAAYGFAWAETFAMTGGAIAEQFTYRDLPRMLRWGSLFYATYFVISFPMIYRLDEGATEDWPLRRVAVEALAAGMLLLFALDLLTHAIGRLY